MKKKIIVFVALTFFLSFHFARPVKAVMEPGQIICHCTLTGFCKASGGGSICAQSAPGGNIHCDDYNGNC